MDEGLRHLLMLPKQARLKSLTPTSHSYNNNDRIAAADREPDGRGAPYCRCYRGIHRHRDSISQTRPSLPGNHLAASQEAQQLRSPAVDP